MPTLHLKICPKKGKNIAILFQEAILVRMDDASLDQTLLDYLCKSTGLPRGVCERFVLDVLAGFGETLEAFVRRRHTELKATTDLKNDAIYQRIAEEVPERRFVASPLSTRQIRRLIYG